MHQIAADELAAQGAQASAVLGPPAKGMGMVAYTTLRGEKRLLDPENGHFSLSITADYLMCKGCGALLSHDDHEPGCPEPGYTKLGVRCQINGEPVDETTFSQVRESIAGSL